HMPVGIAGNNEVIVSGAGVFKNYKLVGYLNEMENRDVAILNGDLVQDGLDTQYEDSNLSLLIANLKSKRKIITGDEDIKVIFNVQVEGQIHEFILDDNDKIDSDLIIKDMEKVLCKEMEKGLNKTIYKLQRELNADVIGILEHLYRFHPSLWEQVKDDWDSIFPQLDIKVNIDLNIRRRGLTT
ncbi:MAG TPA: Ger(x)C family spore germination C-terminal domain-containing protein, partial [Tissierellaceae bacterium]|nr:Ger(x)C family spore germination C-terminal domain-containing protein [Tissierellaceae bacterium]